jgi:hypothetical protein
MPEHVRLLLSEPQQDTLPDVRQPTGPCSTWGAPCPLPVRTEAFQEPLEAIEPTSATVASAFLNIP